MGSPLFTRKRCPATVGIQATSSVSFLSWSAVRGILGLAQAVRHLAGNSLGGRVAMELAKTRQVRSVTLLSPAGLWRGGTPLYCRVSLRLSRWLATQAGLALSGIVATRPGCVVVCHRPPVPPRRPAGHRPRHRGIRVP
jgi:pimeloyl-ACP methyl ester carboxylesterase